MSSHALPIEPAQIVIDRGVPTAPLFGDVYHSRRGGLSQARVVFLGGNQLPQRWIDGSQQGTLRDFVVLEVGFGLGLTMLATALAWQEQRQAGNLAAHAHLHLVSIEKHPVDRATLQALHSQHPDFGGANPQLAELSQTLIALWPVLSPGCHRIKLATDITLTLMLGDVLDLAPQLRLGWDALYLDGFAPARNPDTWAAPMFKALARRARPGATLATWSVATDVRTALTEAGFALQRLPGFGRKRERLIGQARHGRPPVRPWTGPREAVVIGAGLAGSAIAASLAQRGWQITVIDQQAQPGMGTSGNPAGTFHPHVSRDDSVLSRLTRAGCLRLLQTLAQTAQGGPDNAPAPVFAPVGHLQVADDAEQAEQLQQALAAGFVPQPLLRWVDAAQAAALSGINVAQGGIWFEQGGAVDPGGLSRLWIQQAQAAGARFVGLTHVTGLMPSTADDGSPQWQLTLQTASARTTLRSPVVIVATAFGDALQLAAPTVSPSTGADCVPAPVISSLAGAPKPVRGQISLLSAQQLAPPRCAVTGPAYLVPPMRAGATTVVGATYDHDDADPTLRTDSHISNLQRLTRLQPPDTPLALPDAHNLPGRVGFRSVSRDRLPLVGEVVDEATAVRVLRDKGGSRLDAVPRLPGLYCAIGYASRGLLWSQLAADVLTALLDGLPMPLEGALVDAIDPGRFILARARSGRLRALTNARTLD